MKHRSKTKFFLILVLLSAVLQSHASHIVGGELNYTYLGNNNYRLRLIVYRDCFNGTAPFDNPADIGIFDSGNAFFQQQFVAITNQTSVPNYINSPCLVPTTKVCYDYAEYINTLNLRPLNGEY